MSPRVAARLIRRGRRRILWKMRSWSRLRWLWVVALTGAVVTLLVIRVFKPAKFDDWVYRTLGFSPTAAEWRVAAIVVLAAATVAAIIWEIPRLQVARWRRLGISDEIRLAELGNSARATLTQALGGLALVATLALTAYQANETRKSSSENIRVAEEGQATQLISHAVDQLGATAGGRPSLPTRVGALYALTRLAKTEEETRIVNDILAAYVRVNRPPLRAASAARPPCARTGTPAVPKLGPDVTTALELIATLSPPIIQSFNYQSYPAYDLDPADLERADFSDGVLERVTFQRLDLGHASFRGADLRGATFKDVSIAATDFRDACLRDARFQTDDMQEKWDGIAFDARGADLTGARIDGQPLRRFRRMNDKLTILVDARTRM